MKHQTTVRITRAAGRTHEPHEVASTWIQNSLHVFTLTAWKSWSKIILAILISLIVNTYCFAAEMPANKDCEEITAAPQEPQKVQSVRWAQRQSYPEATLSQTQPLQQQDGITLPQYLKWRRSKKLSSVTKGDSESTGVRQTSHTDSQNSVLLNRPQTQPSDPINDPFGDRIAQRSQSDESDPTPPSSKSSDEILLDLLNPNDKDEETSPILELEEDLPTQPTLENVPTIDEPAQETETSEIEEPVTPQQPQIIAEPEPLEDDQLDGHAETQCEQTPNGRDCCEEEEHCDRAIDAAKQSNLREISLDVTPSIASGDDQEAEETAVKRREDLAQSEVRDWLDHQGNLRATGRMVDFLNGQIIVNGDTETTAIAFSDLGKDERCFVAAWWGLPAECHIGDETYTERSFATVTYTWKASGLCHKPLYFEQIQLERYGHSAGPLVQPILSAAHFFASAALLPYKMGINPPSECQYSLGYYRPGECAPYLVPPLPISLRGATAQAGAILGPLYFIP